MDAILFILPIHQINDAENNLSMYITVKRYDTVNELLGIEMKFNE